MTLKILQINTTVNTGSTGRIAEGIGRVVISNGNTSFIAAGYTDRPSKSNIISIGNSLDRHLHGVKSRMLDQHGFGSGNATLALVKKIKEIKPDVIHLHNLHGYYIHVGHLFEYLKSASIPVVWTLHDCWSFTGHCCFFDSINCNKWETQCHNCELFNKYPKSFFVDNSTENFKLKKDIFNGLNNLTIVTPCSWLQNKLKSSFLSDYTCNTIHNGTDTKTFIPKEFNRDALKQKLNITEKEIILGVASVWDKRKGLGDFLKLSKIIADTEVIVLVGLSKEVIKTLPDNVIGIERTENIEELVALYNLALVFINPTWVDNFPTTNIEALACGTPVITYDTGGSVEAVDERTGFIVEKGNVAGLLNAVEIIKLNGKAKYSYFCRERAEKLFNDHDRYNDYIALYKEVILKPA